MRIVVLLLFVLFTGCGQSSYLSEQELLDYTLEQSNGLYHKKETKQFEITLYNKPTGLLMAQEIGVASDSSQYCELEDRYSKYLYFILELSMNDSNPLYRSSSQEEFGENLQTLSFRMNQFVNLTTASRDTIPVLDFVYPRMYGMSSSAAIMFAFDTTGVLSNEYFNFNLSEFGMGTGSHSFRFDREDVLAVPRLLFPENK